MADEDDDYMGDLSKFIPPEPSHPSKPKKTPTANKTLNPSQPSKKPSKNPKLNRQQKQFQEDQQTLANLETAIPPSNIGFKLLKQMGYTPGSGIGPGRAEPVGLEIRREEELAAEFGVRQKLQWRSRRVVVNYHKAKAALDQLENREPEIEKEKDEDAEEDDEEEEEQITEEDLLEILMKLREEHRYCLFCGCQYETMEALLGSCPGINEDDH